MNTPEYITLALGGPADGTKTYNAPAAWHERIRALAPCLVFGPNYRRAVAYSLTRMDELVRLGYSVGAYDHLCSAERAAS